MESKAKRAKLRPRREPYWSRLRAGAFLGFRKLAAGEGTWIVRLRVDGKQRYQSLGHVEPIGKKDAFDVAKEQAEAWLRETDQGISARGETVADACRLYVENLEIEKGKTAASDPKGRFKRLVYEATIGKVTLASLRDRHVTAWRNAQLPALDEEDPDALRAAKDSINRNLSSLKAALNYARRKKLISGDDAWRDVRPFEKVRKRRSAFLTIQQRKRLLRACGEDLRQFCTAALLTAARPGELANANVADFDRNQGLLTLGGKTGRRTVALSTAAAQLLKDSSKGRIGAAPLLKRADGTRWHRYYWREKFREAASAAKLPSDVVLYTLRHVAITEFIQSGIDPSTVAQLAGTSTKMIDEHYGHLVGDRARARLDLVRVI